MDYLKVYNQLIDRAKYREQTEELVGYFEKHHIIPRCKGGLNLKDNLVKLTFREHLICHILLAKIYGGRLWIAVHRMTNYGEHNSKKYALYRQNYVEAISGENNPHYGKKTLHTPETCLKISKATTGRLGGMRGKKRSESHTNSLRKALAKPVKAFRLVTKEFVGTYDSITQCAELLKVTKSKIVAVLKGKRPHTGGYFFERAE